MISITDKAKCCGCGACKNVCPVQCIEMIPDEEGFLYPIINENECINCDLCLKSCQYIRQINIINTFDSPVVYAAKSKDEFKLKKSSSGGVAQVLSDYIIEEHGTVFGAAYDKNMRVEHILIEIKEDVTKLQGSKYVQSDINKTYQEAMKRLATGKKVLFTGTPCQIAGLYYFLGTDYENLYTMDLICYGVPSPKVFAEYIQLEQEKHRSKIVDINFRDKSLRWGVSTTKIVFEDERENITQLSNENKYYRIFLSHYATRPACHNCLYTKIKRYADITVGDYWGIAKFSTMIDCKSGVSKVLINTLKGQQLFHAIEQDISFIKMPLNTAIRTNLKSPPLENQGRKLFFHDFNTKGFDFSTKKYIKSNLIVKAKRKLYKILNFIGILNFAKQIIKKS